MLAYKMISDDVLEVVETLHGFRDTKVSYWYYDIKKWWKSSHGKEGDKPDLAMTRSDIEWVKKYYLPKVGKTGNPLQDNPASWVIKNKATGEVLFETFDRAVVDALNTDKYEAVGIYDHLVSLNSKKEA